jgi:predicted Rossmann fold flavoprotein
MGKTTLERIAFHCYNTPMDKNEFDVIVIGAGPAGIMAAGMSAKTGRRTLLLEKNDLIGRKLSLSGGGRCNISTLVPQNEFLQAFGRDGQFLRQAINVFGPEELKNFLNEIDVDVYEQGPQLFIAGGGKKLIESLVAFLNRQHVEMAFNQNVTAISPRCEGGFNVSTTGEVFVARQKVILAAGGRSYPTTGSTGDGFSLAKSLGHDIHTPVPAMGEIHLKDSPFGGLAGISLEDVLVEVFFDAKREGKFRGGFLITHHGVSGPAILNASLAIARGLQKKQNVSIRLHFFPDRPPTEPDAVESLPQRLREMILQRADVDRSQKNIQFSRVQRHEILTMLTGWKFDVADTGSWDQAMVTVGGVSLKEVDPKTMQSRIVPGLYFAGEVLDLAGACGGYNIQASLSTGYLAGVS